MSHLVRHGDVADGGRHVLAVVHERDDAGVEALVAPAVVLRIGHLDRGPRGHFYFGFWMG